MPLTPAEKMRALRQRRKQSKKCMRCGKPKGRGRSALANCKKCSQETVEAVQRSRAAD